MSAHIEDDQFPAVVNPLVGLPFRDTNVELAVFQVRPLTWAAAADWCGGEQAVIDGGQAVILPDAQGTAKLGDFIVTRDNGATYIVEPADGYAQRWFPRDNAAGTDGDPPPAFLYPSSWS
jgi:hypothetical protein